MTLPALPRYPHLTGRRWEWRHLKVAGDDIIGLGYVHPASKSMHDSSLHVSGKEERLRPIMKGVDVAIQSLHSDKLHQGLKYGCNEPNATSSRLKVDLPSIPQHMKYSWSQRTDSFGVKYNKQTLEKWFSDLDRDGSGSISQRELIVALRARPETMKMFERANSYGKQSPRDRREEPNEPQISDWASSTQVRAEREKVQIGKMKQILTDIDQDGNGCMEWDEFVDFFRRAGMLLEYKTQEHLNWTTLCEQAKLVRMAEDEVAEKEQHRRRYAVKETDKACSDLTKLREEHAVTPSSLEGG